MESLELEIYQGYTSQMGVRQILSACTPVFSTLEILSEQFDAFFFDGFGTLYNLSEKHTGSAEALAFLRAKGKQIRLITNAASRPVEHLQRHLSSIGIHFDISEIISSGDLLTDANKHLQIQSAMHLGREEALPFLGNAGIKATDQPTEPCVILSAVSPKDTDRLQIAKGILAQANARLIVLNPDAWAPKLDGTRIPVSGAAAWNLHKATGCELILLGKPFPEIFHRAILTSNASLEKCVMIGDTLGTDILGGYNAGISTALIFGGNTKLDSVNQDEKALGIRPNFYLKEL